jgi:hypothetical protein
MAWCTSRHDKTPCRSPLRREVLLEAFCHGPASVPHPERLPPRDASPRRSRDVRTARVSTQRRAVGCQLAPLPNLRVAAKEEIRAGTSSIQTFLLRFDLRLAAFGVAPANHFARASARRSGIGVPLVQKTGRVAHKPLPPRLTQPHRQASASARQLSGLPLQDGSLGFRPEWSAASSRVAGPTEQAACATSRRSSCSAPAAPRLRTCLGSGLPPRRSGSKP